MRSIPKVFFAIFILVLGIATKGDGQNYAFQQFTVEDGLPGSTVYSIIQDKNKFLWFATDGGLCKFDGQSFQVVKNEKIKSEIIKLNYDSKDRLWMIDLAKNVSYFEKGSLNEMSSQSTEMIYEDLKNNFWFFHPQEISLISETNSLDQKPVYSTSNDEYFTGLKVFLPVDTNYNIVLTRHGLHHFKNMKPSLQPFTKESPSIKSFPRSALLDNGSILFSSVDRLFSVSINSNKIHPAFTEYNHHFDVGINDLFYDADRNLWVTTRNGVLYFQKQKDGSTKLIKLLEGYVTQSFFQDHQMNIWISTQREGVFKLSSNKIKIYKNEKFGDRVAVVHSFSENEIIVGYNNNWVSFLDKDLNSVFEKKLSISNEEIYDIAVDEEKQEAYLTANFGIFKVKNNPFSISYFYKTSGLKTATIGKNDNLLIGSFSYLMDFKPKKYKKTILKKRTYTVTLGSGNDFWVGTVDGLLYCKNYDCHLVENPSLQQDIRDLEMAENGQLWIATQSNGLFIFENGKIQKHFTTLDGLSSNNCQKIELDKECAWVSTSEGISKVYFSDFSIDIIRVDDGLPSNEVKYLHQKNGKIYAATNKGLAVFDTGLKVYNNPPYLSFSNIQIKNKDTTLLSSYELPYNQNNIEIEFKGVTFKNANEILYQKKLTGINEDWVTTNLNVASYPSLPYGEYDFFVKAKGLNSGWTKEQKISFVIKKAFWQTWLFFGLIALVLFLLGIFFLQKVIASIKRRNEIEQNLTESQLVALRAQMNPHFIFNALNSIQDFIVKEDKRSANHYLSLFSKLMRNILVVSDKTNISLKQEFDYLKLYLSLEALRFGDTFEYHFEIDEKINEENTMIPSMLIQPFVENAIKHGLMHRGGAKKLFIRFFQKENHLLCEVEDNGVGRKRSKEINELNLRVYKSKAMGLTQERIDLLNSAYSNKLGLEIEDLKNKHEIPEGTKVMIRIFQQKNKNIASDNS